MNHAHVNRSFEETFKDSRPENIDFDEEIEKVIKDLLYHSDRIDARDITVSVRNQNVTLSGSVKSQTERDYAISVSKLVQGVGKVENQLIVKHLNEGILPTDVGRNP
jgi:osmotically-inducible protein OsmY